MWPVYTIYHSPRADPTSLFFMVAPLSDWTTKLASPASDYHHLHHKVTLS
jgi:hypothetical protein